MCLDSDKKILHLCEKHVIVRRNINIVFSEVSLEHIQVICWRSCLKFFNEIHQNVKLMISFSEIKVE